MPYPSSYLKSIPIDFYLTQSCEDGVQLTPSSDMDFLLGASGISGTSGGSGYSGESGYSGYSGSSGYSGQLGYSGYFGYSGYSGDDSVNASSGYSGLDGINGSSGYSGESGYVGISGYSGNIGISGYSGKSGYSGISAYIGKSGYSGIKYHQYLYNSVTTVSNSIGSLLISETLKTYTLPANTLSVNGDAIEIEVIGSTVSAGTSKTLFLKFGSETVGGTSGTLSGVFRVFTRIYRTGSSAQVDSELNIFGDDAASFKEYTFVDSNSLTQNLSNNIVISCVSLTAVIANISVHRFTVRKLNGITLT